MPKRRRPPRYAAGVVGCPALLGKPGGCAPQGYFLRGGTRGCAPQTVLALIPVAPSAARRRKGQFENRMSSSPHAHQSPLGVPSPLEDAEQRRLERGSGRALSEGEARVAQPPLEASSGGNPAAGGASTRGRLFFGYILLAKQKKVSPRVRRGTQWFSNKPHLSAPNTLQSPFGRSARRQDRPLPKPTPHAKP